MNSFYREDGHMDKYDELKWMYISKYLLKKTGLSKKVAAQIYHCDISELYIRYSASSKSLLTKKVQWNGEFFNSD